MHPTAIINTQCLLKTHHGQVGTLSDPALTHRRMRRLVALLVGAQPSAMK